MALPPDETAPPGNPPPAEVPPPRPELRLIEASEAQERTCADCGKRTTAWKPVRRKGAPIILCPECAARPPPPEGGCPQCGAPLGPGDSFCGRCGTRIEYACPNCGAVLEAEDGFCGKCGSRVV